jgi:hypothetical protein
MEFLSEDVTPLLVVLGILAAAFLLALRVSQQGKYLLWAGAALGLALMALLIEQLWVTNGERCEQVVYQLRDAAAASSGDTVLSYLTPDVQYEERNHTLLEGESARAFIRQQLALTRFDFIRITHLEAKAGRQSGRGSAEFRVLASGIYEMAGAPVQFGSTQLDLSLGFRETAPEVWKIDRITLTRGVRGMPSPVGAPSQPGSVPRSGRRRNRPTP